MKVVLGLCLYLKLVLVVAMRNSCQTLRPCTPCTAQERVEIRACDETGYYQTMSCLQNDKSLNSLGRLVQQSNKNKTNSHFTMKESCMPDNTGVNAVIRFELIMVFAALYSLNFVRKRRRAAYQRLTTIVNS